MTWEQLKEASKYGALGLHSYGHLHLSKSTPLQIYQDTKKAYALFKKHLGFVPTSYAYPYGEYDTTVKDIVKAFGFTSIVNQSMGAISHKSDIHDLDRIALMNDSNYKSFFKIKHLNAQWNDVVIDTKTRTLKRIDVTVDKSIKKIQCYISGDVWHVLKVKEGKIQHTFNLPLNKGRTRVILKTYDNHYSSKIFIF
jgi:peptidoglycan/xylan/chitin deacetylase (PgdA/CDA1 family)